MTCQILSLSATVSCVATDVLSKFSNVLFAGTMDARVDELKRLKVDLLHEYNDVKVADDSGDRRSMILTCRSLRRRMSLTSCSASWPTPAAALSGSFTIAST